MRPARLDDETVTRTLAAELPTWQLEGGFLHRRYTFADFDTAWAWMNQVAAEARALDHHPDWSNVYNRVDVALQTHDAGGITSLDLTLATRCEALWQASQAGD
jgi:4a-hydroxytetrahydrobiopterin dehydratase